MSNVLAIQARGSEIEPQNTCKNLGKVAYTYNGSAGEM